jgi:outer membrane protein assembly factor BamB
LFFAEVFTEHKTGNPIPMIRQFVLSFSKLTLLLCPILFIIFSSCSENNSDPKPDPVKDNPMGMLYINIVGQYMKLDASNDSIYWKAQTLYLFNSYRNPMTFNSDYFYHGNYTSMTCYSAVTGLPAWSFSWLAFNDAISYHAPAFNDSLIFFSSPTSVWDHGSLYCKNKKTGAFVWQVPIDSGEVDINFNGIPVLNSDKVLTLTRNQNNEKHLTAFSIRNGTWLWSTPVSDGTASKWWLLDGRLYSAYGPEAVCLDASTGKLLWETNMNTPNAAWTYNFLDGDKLIVVKVLNNTNYKILQIQKSNGAITSTKDLTIPTTYAPQTQMIAPLGCSYGDNDLYFASFNDLDSLDILSYNITDMTQQWKKRFANSYFTGEPPILTDKYLIFPVNDQYNAPDPNHSNVIFLNHSGELVKKIPFDAAYVDGFVYKEDGVIYPQTQRF